MDETRSLFFGHGYDVVRCLFHIENKLSNKKQKMPGCQQYIWEEF